jgi:hypothetical protein
MYIISPNQGLYHTSFKSLVSAQDEIEFEYLREFNV